MSDISEHNIWGFESYLNVPTHLLKWAKKDSIPPGQMLEILLIWGELGHIFKENVLLFLVMIPYYLILSIMMIGYDPDSYYHAQNYPRWKGAMDEEFNSLRKNAT